MTKPKGGRGLKAPYETHQIRVPDPIAPQVHSLIEQYQDYLKAGGNPATPPELLSGYKPVDKFNEQKVSSSQFLESIRAAVESVLKDEAVTRNGRDRGAVRRGLKALLSRLEAI